MENLIRISVADSAEEPRIRERSLERVILLRQLLAEYLLIGFEGLDSASIDFSE